MKQHLCLLAAVCLVSGFENSYSQKVIPNSSVTGVSLAGNKTNRIFIPPPAEFFRKSGTSGRASITLLLNGFPDNAASSVKYAASILETILPADTKITISAYWEKITTSGVLANSSITGFAGGWTINAQNPRVVYPLALAEKIAGESLNDSLTSDIDLTVNSTANWYMATDGNTPGLKYDLVTVVLHELCHGLGFFDSMSTNSTIGWYGLGPFPLIYDVFLENLQGRKLTDTLAYPNYSAALRSALIGGNLYFNGPLLKNYTLGGRARIYAPATWDPGSSISHLDENFTIEPNTLMTPFIDMGEAIHDPGRLTMSILGDLGWVNTRFSHTVPHDTEGHISTLPLITTVVSDTAYDHYKVCTVYSYDNFATDDTIFMISPGSDNTYSCSVPVPSYNSQLQYYFFTEDTFKRIYRSPSYIDSVRYKVFIGTDTVRPVIEHVPLTSCLETIDTLHFIATVSDNLGIDTVYVEYRLDGGPSAYLGLKAGRGKSYSAGLNVLPLHIAGGDSIEYRIIAHDSAGVRNSRMLPADGYFAVHVEGLSSVEKSYITDFTGSASDDFINSGFNVQRPIGFVHSGLNSIHPYESPEDNSKTINYTSILRHPLKIDESGLIISFREIVLVEPGAPGSSFGSADFYDYVILEGSRNFGKTWVPLTPGYDSRFHKSWEDTYNSSSDGMNSTAKGTESMLYDHSILCAPSDKISTGDTMLLRFRLFSDPFANGWGWCIENLQIKAFIDAVENVPHELPVSLYPNPGNGRIRVGLEDSGTDYGKPVKYSIFNISGVCIRNDYLSGQVESIIDISDKPAGIYIIVLYRDDWLKTIRYSLIK